MRGWAGPRTTARDACCARAYRGPRAVAWRLHLSWSGWLAFLLTLVTAVATASDFKLDFKYNSTTAVDSTRKDYSTITYPDFTTLIPVGVPETYDKTFVGNISDLALTLKGDLTESQIFDVKENLHYQGYRPEDYNSTTDDSYKYRYLDHLLNVTYGIAFTKRDNLQLDYWNSVYELPIDAQWNYRYHLGRLQFSHHINKDSTLTFQGGQEQREFPNDFVEDYRENVGAVEFSVLFPEKLHYRPVSNSSRGTDQAFKQVGNGFAAKKPTTWYTTWTKKPGEDSDEAKFLTKVARGDLFVTARGEYLDRSRTHIANGYDQPRGLVQLQYDASERTRLRLEGDYYVRRHERESEAYALYDHNRSRANMAATYLANADITSILTLGYEQYKHLKFVDQDYRITNAIVETYYRLGQANISGFLKNELTRYRMPRVFYPDADYLQAIVTYQYPFSHSCSFRLKDEWVDCKYDSNQNEYYSSYVRNVYRLGVAQQLDRYNTLELSYQEKREHHKTFTMNDITEKTLMFSWLGTI